jgi:hypothetical protein
LEKERLSKLLIVSKFINFSLSFLEEIIEYSEDKDYNNGVNNVDDNKEDDGGKYCDPSISIILSLLLLSDKEDNGIEVEEKEEENDNEGKLKLSLSMLSKKT